MGYEIEVVGKDGSIQSRHSLGGRVHYPEWKECGFRPLNMNGHEVVIVFGDIVKCLDRLCDEEQDREQGVDDPARSYLAAARDLAGLLAAILSGEPDAIVRVK